MKWVTLCALAVGLAFVAVGCGGAGKQTEQVPAEPGAVINTPVAQREIKANRGPFAAGGGLASGPGSGLWGDTVSGPDGSNLGCIPGRHYADAVTFENRSKRPITLTDATGKPERAPEIIHRVATQLRLAPPPAKPSHNLGGGVVVTPLRHWSRAPARPVTIPPGRSAVVQSNFLMHRCTDLAGGRTLVVPGDLVLTYRAGSTLGREQVADPGARIILTRGPTKLSCTRVVGGLSNILAANLHCSVARRAAVACHRMSHGSWGMCTSDGTLWECSRTEPPRGSAWTEMCYRPRSKSHWFRVSWKHRA